MTPAEAIDLLSIAARSSTWDARPADAAALLEVVTRQEAEVERLRTEYVPTVHRGFHEQALRDIAARQREACAAWLSPESAAVMRKQVPLVTDGPVAHEGSPTVVEGGTPRGPELDAAVLERCECGHPWSKHRPGKYGGCCEWGCMCERLPRAAVREQPAPKPGGEAVWPSLLASGLVPESLRADCEARHRLGVERYGRALEAGNGRDALADAYQEALDLAVYLWQRRLEDMQGGHGGAVLATMTGSALEMARNIKERCHE